MPRKSKNLGSWVRVSVIALAVLFLLAACSSIGGALASAMTKPAASSAQPAAPATAAPAAPVAQAPAAQATAATAPAPTQPKQGASPAIAYQYQFNAFYSGMWSMGWFGYADANYKPGQGTLFSFSGSGSSSNSATFERALLKINADASQWWRFKLDTGKSSILYEFLVGPDSVLQKVRYKDPDNGAIGEFIPGPPQQQPAQAQPAMPKSRAEMDTYLVGKQQVQVKGGSFMADHYLYSDANGKGSAEMWTSDKVPGYLVKTVYTSKKDNKTSTGELVQIESGVTTALSSY
jgi:hypothetical protein